MEPNLSILQGESNGDKGTGQNRITRLRSLSDDNDLLDYKEMKKHEDKNVGKIEEKVEPPPAISPRFNLTIKSNKPAGGFAARRKMMKLGVPGLTSAGGSSSRLDFIQ